MNRILGTTLFFLVATAAQAECVAPDPAATARWVYEHAASFYVSGEGKAHYLSPQLLKLLQRDWKCQEPGEVCAIEAYPWTDTQDGDVLAPVEFKLVNENRQAATVEMGFRFGWEDSAETAKPMRIRLKLVRPADTGCWLLDDILHGKASFKQGLNGWPYENP